ncbi:transposase [Nannocystis exedens]|uniref:transposase n=1 Tax=Nannocystis exedens TaxID=54 RepID=UPI00147545D6|nr:transposase [Nannocystis exedens]
MLDLDDDLPLPELQLHRSNSPGSLDTENSGIEFGLCHFAHDITARFRAQPTPPSTLKSRKIWADSVYNGQQIKALANSTGIDIETVKRTDDMSGFVVLPRRWTVERTFGWLDRFGCSTENMSDRSHQAPQMSIMP